MKRLAVAISLLLIVTGATTALAKDYGKDNMLGTWSFDLHRMMTEQMKAAGGGEIPPGVNLDAMLAGSYMRITFTKDGKYVVDQNTPMGKQNQTGDWEVVEAKGEVVTMKITSPDEGEQSAVVTFVDDDNFEVEMGEEGMRATLHAHKMTEKELKALEVKEQ